MNYLDNLNKRLQYQGGTAEGRFIRDKQVALRQSLLYSYQACTITLADGRDFRCLINPSKTKADYDYKVISIPYKDVCLNKGPAFGETPPDTTTNGLEEIGMKPGDVFYWGATDSHWLVILEHLNEDAYFRADICRCDQEIEVEGVPYWVYLRGPDETSIQWMQKAGIEWNKMNYSMVMFITKDELTEAYFHRFVKIKIFGNNWEVAAINPLSNDGIIKVMLIEAKNNTIEEAVQAENALIEKEFEPSEISGPNVVESYSMNKYEVPYTGGYWRTDSDKVRFVTSDDASVVVEVTSGKSKEFILEYVYNESVLSKKIQIIAF